MRAEARGEARLLKKQEEYFHQGQSKVKYRARRSCWGRNGKEVGGAAINPVTTGRKGATQDEDRERPVKTCSFSLKATPCLHRLEFQGSAHPLTPSHTERLNQN